MTDEKYVLTFNGCAEFIGTKEECESRYNKECDRWKKFYRIRPVSDTSHNNNSVDMTKHHSSVSYDRDGDVAYYN